MTCRKNQNFRGYQAISMLRSKSILNTDYLTYVSILGFATAQQISYNTFSKNCCARSEFGFWKNCAGLEDSSTISP